MVFFKPKQEEEKSVAEIEKQLAEAKKREEEQKLKQQQKEQMEEQEEVSNFIDEENETIDEEIIPNEVFKLVEKIGLEETLNYLDAMKNNLIVNSLGNVKEVDNLEDIEQAIEGEENELPKDFS